MVSSVRDFIGKQRKCYLFFVLIMVFLCYSRFYYGLSHKKSQRGVLPQWSPAFRSWSDGRHMSSHLFSTDTSSGLRNLQHVGRKEDWTSSSPWWCGSLRIRYQSRSPNGESDMIVQNYSYFMNYFISDNDYSADYPKLLKIRSQMEHFHIVQTSHSTLLKSHIRPYSNSGHTASQSTLLKPKYATLAAKTYTSPFTFDPTSFQAS